MASDMSIIDEIRSRVPDSWWTFHGPAIEEEFGKMAILHSQAIDDVSEQLWEATAANEKSEHARKQLLKLLDMPEDWSWEAVYDAVKVLKSVAADEGKMARWMKPTEEYPVCDCGDRVVGIVRYREHERGELRPHVVVLVATENGWRDTEDGGFSIEDCELWTLERDLVRIANVV